MNTLSPSWQQKLREEQPDPSKWNTELVNLHDASIEARPLDLPSNMKIELKDSNYVPYWVRRKLGPNPDTTRFMQMRAAGYELVTVAEILEPEKLTAAVSADKSEITCGVDLVLMKAKKEIHYGALKYHHQRALQMTSPRKGTADESLMRSVPNRISSNEGDSRVFNATNTRGLADSEIPKQRGPKWDEISSEAQGKKEK